MAVVTATKGSFTVKAYVGDNKTLLAFNFVSQASAKNLAGFTIACQPPGQPSYYLFNDLQFQTPSNHAQVSTAPANSTINAPIQKYRWTHVPGSTHQGLQPVTGAYIYSVTPRYFDANQSMQPLDPSLTVPVTVPVGPFKKGSLALGFTRGYMQSEAFAHHFGPQASLQPTGHVLLYNTTQQAGTNAQGQSFTYADEYLWMGSTARVQVFKLLNEVLNDTTLHLDMFAYDLNEPDILQILLQLAKGGRVRIILDNAALHTNKAKPTPEDQFTALFQQQGKNKGDILRGSFGRYSHDKVLIVSKNGSATQVLTGSTNFSVTGLYVNANHVLVFNDATVAQQYAKVFQQSWQVLTQFPKTSRQAAAAFASTPLATMPFKDQSPTVPKMSITFSPHSASDTNTILSNISARINAEASAPRGSVLFAVMQLTNSQTPVYDELNKIHATQSIFSYGISDAPEGTYLHTVGTKTGVLVTGKPGSVTLPPPFDQVHSIAGHEIHDKFVVCGLNGADPVVYCGSSNLATGGEESNGDNLLEIHDADVATAFAIEALLLVDHYAFLDRYAAPKKPKPAKTTPGKKTAAKKTSVKIAAKAPPKKTPTKKAQTKKKSAKKSRQ
ncbi:MAG: phospholipase D-like domain-containing protein [Terriglobia bacterium]|jgi:hypothetical protein